MHRLSICNLLLTSPIRNRNWDFILTFLFTSFFNVISHSDRSGHPRQRAIYAELLAPHPIPPLSIPKGRWIPLCLRNSNCLIFPHRRTEGNIVRRALLPARTLPSTPDLKPRAIIITPTSCCTGGVKTRP